MKRLISLVLALTFASAAQAAQTYPLTCRGGGSTLGLTIGVSTVDNSAVVYYAKAAGSAPAGLTSGQCSWQDRAIGPNEPPCLKFYSPSATAWIFTNSNNRGLSYATNLTNSDWIRDLLDANKTVTFQAYNPGNGGCFIATRIGF